MTGASNRVDAVDRHRSGLPLARIALLLAALVALVAVGIAVRRGSETVAMAAATPSAGRQADVATMIAQLEARMKADPRDASGWRMLGWSYYRTGRFADATGAYRHATTADPKNVEGWSALGEILSLAGEGDVPAEAEAAFRKALAIDPADPRARYFLAAKKDLAGEHKAALDDWIALLKDTPPGAPWERNVREAIAQVAVTNRIDVAATPLADARSAATEAIPGATREHMRAAAALPPGQQGVMVRRMVDSLAVRLKASPRDADGWLRLMRARMVLGDPAAAGQALRDGLAAFPADKATQATLSEGARALGVRGA